MTSAASKPPVVSVPLKSAKKTRAQSKAPSRGIFRLLSDWKIDTQAFRDEMRR